MGSEKDIEDKRADFQKKLTLYQIWATVFGAIGTGLLGFGIASQTLAGAMIIQSKASEIKLGEFYLSAAAEYFEIGEAMLWAGLALIIFAGGFFSIIVSKMRQ
jgi:hypothetical protein